MDYRRDSSGDVVHVIPTNQLPLLVTSSASETGRSYNKGRKCKKFYTEEGCPYGDNCTFLHDEASRSRESVAISLGPSNVNVNVKLLNWKTRICNKWEITGYCPFGSKCHFAHGAAELHRYGGGIEGSDAKDASDAPDPKQSGVPSKTAETTGTLFPRADVYHHGVPSQRTSIVIQKPGQRTHNRWKGPDKISRIYGDWIDDVE